MIQEIIKQLIGKAIQELQEEGKLESAQIEQIPLEHPEEEGRGDYATPIALQLAKQLGKNPREIADFIVSKLEIQHSKLLDKIELAGPGFINLYISS